MVIYQFRKHPQINHYFVDTTVQAMFGCGLGETYLHTSQGGDKSD